MFGRGTRSEGRDRAKVPRKTFFRRWKTVQRNCFHFSEQQTTIARTRSAFMRFQPRKGTCRDDRTNFSGHYKACKPASPHQREGFYFSKEKKTFPYRQLTGTVRRCYYCYRWMPATWLGSRNSRCSGGVKNKFEIRFQCSVEVPVFPGLETVHSRRGRVRWRLRRARQPADRLLAAVLSSVVVLRAVVPAKALGSGALVAESYHLRKRKTPD